MAVTSESEMLVVICYKYTRKFCTKHSCCGLLQHEARIQLRKPGKWNGMRLFYVLVGLFWVMIPCSVVIGYQRFGGPRCVHLQGEATNQAADAL